MDLLAAPVRGVRELVGQPVGVPAPIVENEIFGIDCFRQTFFADLEIELSMSINNR
jgi:hypothetical protein